MYFQIDTVFEKYDLGGGTVSRGRQVLLCEKQGRLYGLKEFAGTEKKAEFLYRLGQYLGENGILTDELLPTVEGEFCTEGVDGVKYTLHRWYRGRECDVRNRLEILMAVSHLAHFHRVCQSFVPQEGDLLTEETPWQEYLRHTRELKKIYQFISRRKKKSEFELLYMRCFHEFFSQCQDVCSRIERCENDAMWHICHGDFNYHNVIFSGGKPVILHFAKAGYGVQIFDFCNFLRKTMEKYGWDETLGMAMLEEYHRVNPINREIFWQLYYRLAFPEKFWKLANRYYTSKKAWISPQSYEKLKTEIQLNPSRKKYLNRMLFFYENMDRKTSF